MDVLAVTSVIVAGVAAASTGINAFYSTRRTAKTAREGRAEQRAADGYLKVLSLAEQEARWLDWPAPRPAPAPPTPDLALEAAVDELLRIAPHDPLPNPA